uniref:Uncharacterized protein n=1 Tax=Timema bartmani TaxID=61472 RepID=A0A7R9I1J2_9NEOP|nr:unnamed protein product [Timema bartmani]
MSTNPVEWRQVNTELVPTPEFAPPQKYDKMFIRWCRIKGEINDNVISRYLDVLACTLLSAYEGMGGAPAFAWRDSENPFWENHPKYTDQDSNLNLLVIANLVYCESSALDHLLKEFEDKANEKLQMPPVVKMRKDEQKVLDIEPALQGYSDAKFVFTDITYGLSNKERLVVIRDPDGTLREASMQEHCRISQLYVPMLGRQLTPPPMFQEEYLKLLMEQGEYEFILDRACVQFEPDDPEYHRVTQATYDHIDNCCKYETLRSTRHFGPFAFYLAWHKQIDNLLLMEQGEYEFILDRACVQFEPDDPEYHRVTQATYDHIDNCCKYETLRSTRHFGPFAFYLAWHKQIDNLVLESIHTDRLDEAVALIQLYHILNPESKSASVAYSGHQVQFIQAYVESDANKKSMLELALQTFMELQKQRQEVEEGIQKAHLCQV